MEEDAPQRLNAEVGKYLEVGQRVLDELAGLLHAMLDAAQVGVQARGFGRNCGDGGGVFVVIVVVVVGADATAAAVAVARGLAATGALLDSPCWRERPER